MHTPNSTPPKRRIDPQRLNGRAIANFAVGSALALLAVCVHPTESDAAAPKPPTVNVLGQLDVSSAGAATYKIPISVPPGTAGMAPNLALNYSSQSGDGTVGLGWSLSGLPSIARCPQTYAQDGQRGGINYDGNDRFCLDGQRLMVISGTYGADGAEYRTEIDQFSKIISYGTSGTGPTWFKVWTKSGQILEIGNTSDSRLVAPGTGTVRAWAVNKVSDTSGNYFTVSYVSDGTNGEIYPTEIDYTANDGAMVTAYNSVQFAYNTARPDVTPHYQAGYLQQTTVLLSDIKTYAGATLVGDYQLSYNSGNNLLRSHVTGVTLCDGSTPQNCLPSTTFTWQGNPTTVNFSAAGSAGGALVGDWNGDGLTDILGAPPTGDCNNDCSITLFKGTGSGGFTPVSMPLQGYYIAPAPGYTRTYFSPTAFVIDYNGDGFPDLGLWQTYQDCDDMGDCAIYSEYALLRNDRAGDLVYVNDYNYGLIGSPTGDFNGDGLIDLWWSQTIGGVNYSGAALASESLDGTFYYPSPQKGPTSLSPSIPQYVADFLGDGCSDLLTQSAADHNIYTFYCNEPNTSIPATDWSGYGLVLGDFNGDGLTDVLAINSTGGSFNLSTGGGFTTTGFSVPSYWGSPYYEIITGDFNGDGRTDIALISLQTGTNHEIWLSTGSGFVLAQSIPNTVGGGSGLAGDLANTGASNLMIDNTVYLNSYSPELIVGVNNGIGISSAIAYDRLNDTAWNYAPATGDIWPTRDLNSSMYVASQISAGNGIGGNYITDYSYGGARLNMQGRGFLGFQTVSIFDPQTNITQTTTYRQDFPYIGLIAEQKKTHAGGVVVSDVQNTFASAATYTGATFVYISQSVQTGNDLTGAPLPTTTTSFTYDNASISPFYGNATRVSVSVSDGSSKVTTSTYTNDPSAWLLGRLTAVSTESVVGLSDITRSSSFQYSPTTGLITQEVIEPANPGLQLETDYTYDGFGNRTQIQVSGAGVAARTTIMGYDSNGQFMLERTNALSQSEHFTYDPRFGLPASHTDLNSLVTSWTYDAFGRQVLQANPDGTHTLGTVNFCSGYDGGAVTTCVTNAVFQYCQLPRDSSGSVTVGPDQCWYWDGLSRLLDSDVEGFEGTMRRVLTLYGTQGYVSQVSRPFLYSTSPTIVWNNLTYDDIGRVTLIQYPDTSSANFSYNGLSSTVTDRDGNSTTTLKNAQNLAAQVTDAGSNVTSYLYDAFGNLSTITDAAGNMTFANYDMRGRKISIDDLDLGHWTYSYDGLSKLASQTDNKSQTTTFTYDLVGRMTQRTEPDLTSTWTYDTAANAIGKLASESGTSNAFSRSFSYDTLSRPVQTAIVVSGTTYSYSTAYDSYGRIATVNYPSGSSFGYTYNTAGYLSQISNAAAPSQIFWTYNASDAEGRIEQETFGNGIVEHNLYDANNGRLTNVEAGPGNAVANLSYSHDPNGNVTDRVDANETLTESFCYDNLSRLQYYALGSTCTSSGYQTAIYNAVGNITGKSGWTYSYPSPGMTLPHAVSAISGTVSGIANPNYSYDGNGNLTCTSTAAGCGGTVVQTIGYTAANMTSSVALGSTSISFAYGPEHDRIVQTSSVGGAASTTTYVNDPASGAMSEKDASGSTTVWRDYLIVNGSITAVRLTTVTGGSGTLWGSANWGSFNWGGSIVTTATAYFVLDGLGSVSVITDDSGAVVQRLSYDPWGKRRNPDGTDAACGTITSTQTRGFTNQEEIDPVCLVNLNARIYDPTVARFQVPDTLAQNTSNPQTLNSYTYVTNNPLTFADPTGYQAEIPEEILVTAEIIPESGPAAPILAGLDLIAEVLAGIFGGGGAATLPTIPAIAAPATPAGSGVATAPSQSPTGLTQPANTEIAGAQETVTITGQLPTATGSGPLSNAGTYAAASAIFAANEGAAQTEQVLIQAVRIPPTELPGINPVDIAVATGPLASGPFNGAPAAPTSCPAGTTANTSGSPDYSGNASMYGQNLNGTPDQFAGHVTATGTTMDPNAYTAASGLQRDIAGNITTHPIIPLNRYYVVTSPNYPSNSVAVFMNDTGPLRPGRIIDLSTASMKALTGKAYNLVPVNVYGCH